jgi:hypothetical protein
MTRIATLSALALLAACSGGGDGDTKTVTNTVTNTQTNTVTNTITNDGEVDCTGSVCVLSGTLTDDLTLTADTEWLLRGGVFIGDDVNATTLTIEPGTKIYGESSTDGMLVVRRSSRIVADGTADAPIVFSSSKLEGERARGDWGGLIINGRAPINSCDEGGTGPCEAFGEGGTGFYGGDDPNDDSGVLRYVRVEFAGTLISPDNELNGIAFQGVGAGTVIDHVQVHMNADDGVEFFGGTANAKHILVTGVGDDSLDWTDGWTGNIQFAVLQQYDDAGDQGIEADNNGEVNTATPKSNPTLSNVTVIGSPASATSDIGILLREGTAASLHNIVVMGFNEACLDIDSDESWNEAASGGLTIANSLVDCSTPYLEDDGEPGLVADWFLADTSNGEGSAGLADPYNLTSPDFTGSNVAGAVVPADSFFDQVDFIGGVDPSDDWTAGWTTTAPN